MSAKRCVGWCKTQWHGSEGSRIVFGKKRQVNSELGMRNAEFKTVGTGVPDGPKNVLVEPDGEHRYMLE